LNLLETDRNTNAARISAASATTDAAQAWASADPYAKAGLFESVELIAWKKVIG